MTMRRYLPVVFRRGEEKFLHIFHGCREYSAPDLLQLGENLRQKNLFYSEIKDLDFRQETNQERLLQDFLVTAASLQR